MESNSEEENVSNTTVLFFSHFWETPSLVNARQHLSNTLASPWFLTKLHKVQAGLEFGILTSCLGSQNTGNNTQINLVPCFETKTELVRVSAKKSKSQGKY